MSDPQVIGEYHLLQKLGGGGFGTVYLAEHIHKHTQVAVKILQVSLTKSEDFHDFLNETRTMLRLRHLHIIPLLDVGLSSEDFPFLIMEYASKGTLRNRHPKGSQVPLASIVEYVEQIASALQFAHDHRIIHRDVKPENMLLRADGTLLLSDFGIAKIMEHSTLMSMQTEIGTPRYMAPEQHLGYPCFASDQYALAIVVYEWISGTPPFQGDSLDLAIQHMTALPPSLLTLLPTLSPNVEQVIFKALSKIPEERFTTVTHFAQALQTAVHETTVPMAPTQGVHSPVTPAVHPTVARPHLPETSLPTRHSQTTISHPSRRRSILIALLCLVLLIGSGGFLYINNSTKQANYLLAQQTQESRVSKQAQDMAATATTEALKTAATATANLNPYSSQQGKLVMYDPLKDNSQGYQWEESVGFCQFSDNAYHILMHKFYGGPCRAMSTHFANFTYEVQVKFLKGEQTASLTPGSSSVGMLFRGTGSHTNGYEFTVYMDGSNYLDLRCGNSCGQCLPANCSDSPAASFHKGLNVTNTLAITVQGNTISAYINGQRVIGPVNDDNNTYTSGIIGFEAGGGDFLDTDAAFTNIRVWTS